jgi:TATA-box binding protein (TBP) (component of TFIID and TFIIIB)
VERLEVPGGLVEAVAEVQVVQNVVPVEEVGSRGRLIGVWRLAQVEREVEHQPGPALRIGDRRAVLRVVGSGHVIALRTRELGPRHAVRVVPAEGRRDRVRRVDLAAAAAVLRTLERQREHGVLRLPNPV